MSEDKMLNEIRERHAHEVRWLAKARAAGLQSHRDREWLLEQIERLRAQKEALHVSMAQIERAAAGAIYSQEMIHAMALSALKSVETDAMSDNPKEEKMRDYEIALTQVRAEIQARRDVIAISSVEAHKDLRAAHEYRAMSDKPKEDKMMHDYETVLSDYGTAEADSPADRIVVRMSQEIAVLRNANRDLREKLDRGGGSQRERIATACLAALEIGYLSPQHAAKDALRYADALIEEIDTEAKP